MVDPNTMTYVLLHSICYCTGRGGPQVFSTTQMITNPLTKAIAKDAFQIMLKKARTV